MTTDGNGDAPAEAEAPDTFEDTIWAEVDRALSGISAAPERGAPDLIVRMPPAEVVRGLSALKLDEALDFNYLRSLTAVDFEEEGIEIVYHLYSIGQKHNLTVKTRLPNDALVRRHGDDRLARRQLARARDRGDVRRAL